ncbi:MAG: hypothetical protein U1E81_17855 [Xanthobacteraceae bacterium]
MPDTIANGEVAALMPLALSLVQSFAEFRDTPRHPVYIVAKLKYGVCACTPNGFGVSDFGQHLSNRRQEGFFLRTARTAVSISTQDGSTAATSAMSAFT